MKSVLKYTLELSQEAYDDLVDIQSYTFSTFGENQWEKYNDILDQALKQIVRHPFSGHKRRDIPEGYRALPAAKHVLIYRIEKTVIYLVRVLHERMDFTFHFE